MELAAEHTRIIVAIANLAKVQNVPNIPSNQKCVGLGELSRSINLPKYLPAFLSLVQDLVDAGIVNPRYLKAPDTGYVFLNEPRDIVRKRLMQEI